jgi:hypothetical protein
MGERGTPDARHQLDQQIGIVETCARDLDPRLCDPVSALRRQVVTQPTEGLRGKGPSGESGSVGLHTAVRKAQEVVRLLRGIIAIEGVALMAPRPGVEHERLLAEVGEAHLSDVRDTLARAATTKRLGSDEVQRRCAVLLELEKDLFRVSDTMWDLLRYAEAAR